MQITIDVTPEQLRDAVSVLKAAQPGQACRELLQEIPDAVLQQIDASDNENERFRQIVEDYLLCSTDPEHDRQLFEPDERK